jgi:hypothetical protein
MTEKLTGITTVKVINWHPKPWPDGLALAFSYLRQAKAVTRPWLWLDGLAWWLGPAYFGLAWLDRDFWPETRPYTSLDVTYPPLSGSPFLSHDQLLFTKQTPTNLATFHLQLHILKYARHYLNQHGFIEVYTEKLQPAATESGVGMFKVNCF